MTAYIAGAITGDENYKAKFAEGEERLKREGFTVLNPAVLPAGMTNKEYMRICFAMIDCADIVAFLPDWDESRGANLENAYCQYVSKQTFYMPKLDSEWQKEN